MKIIFYTTGCPKCEVLKKKLSSKNLSYEICEDTNIMLEKGLSSAPALEVNGKIYNFKEAIKFINEMGDA